MDILPNEVESIKVIGNLHGDDVKVVKTYGGFFVAVGKKSKNAKKAEALAAGSHAALVDHQLQKEYGSDYHQAIFKSEEDQLAKVEVKTEYLPSSMIAKGAELFTLTKGNNVDFVLVRHGLSIGEYNAEIENKTLVLKSGGFTDKESITDKEKTAVAMSRILKEKVHQLNLKGIKKVY